VPIKHDYSSLEEKMATETEMRSNNDVQQVIVEPRVAQKQAVENRYVDINGRDEFDHRILSHRADLETLDTQINNLDRTIELEQQKLRESKTALETSYHARARLLHLRSAMLEFVLALELHENK
jgi:hypothetical protein